MRRAKRRRLWTAFTVLATSATLAVAPGSGAAPVSAAGTDNWLDVVNTYREMSGLAPVTANSTWSGEAQAHSCYMLLNGIAHDEIPGSPGYTPGGDVAGNSGNVAVSSSITATARNHIDLWMTGPFHAIGILRHNLVSTGFGLCTNPSTPTWHSAGTLDVIRGIDYSRPRPSTPILFPGDGATVPLNRFITEFPNPLTMCGWSGNAGLPLIAMMPSSVSWATTTLTGPNGPVQTCNLHQGNVSDGTAKSILGGDNAIVVMPRDILANGTYTATVNSSGGNISWSFTVNEGGPLVAPPPPTPDTQPSAAPAAFEPVEPFRLVDSRIGLGSQRLRAGTTTRIKVSTSDAVALSANFVAVQPTAGGYITAYNCTADVPTVATLNYGARTTVSNQALVPLNGGDLCLFSLADTDIVIDVNGFYRDRSGVDAGFVPITPVRMLDTRPGTALQAGKEYELRVAGVSPGAPASARAVALNVTAIQGSKPGHVKLYPCGASTAGEIASLNYAAYETRPNAAVVQVGGAGKICISTKETVNITVDMTGYFATGGYEFQPLEPVRMFDSRSRYVTLNESTNGLRLGAGQVLRIQIAGERGIPADAKAVSVNVAAAAAVQATHLTLFPCGTRPATANVNIMPGQSAVNNGAMVKLSSTGELCIYTLQDVHVILDVNGTWS
jgi:hypothetical protein